jgi:arylsulfatase
VAKYAETYRAGPDAIRQRRFERLKELGLAPESATLPQLDATVTEETKHAKSERNEQWMRNYAAMIDRVDQNLARIVEALRKRGQFDNTLILFLSDNGSDEVRGPLWGQVSNTPFRKFKVWVHDGGIASPLIAHWPAGIPASQRGKIVTGPAHIMDVFPTCLDAAAAKHPRTFANHPVQPLEGISLLPALRGESPFPTRSLVWRFVFGRRPPSLCSFPLRPSRSCSPRRVARASRSAPSIRDRTLPGTWCSLPRATSEMPTSTTAATAASTSTAAARKPPRRPSASPST